MKRLLFSLAAMLAAAGVFAQTAATNAGRSLAATCANCHGTGGVSQSGMLSLAGMSKDDLVRAMKEFKSGARSATVMNQLAKGYTDEQIESVAAWFAAQKPAK